MRIAPQKSILLPLLAALLLGACSSAVTQKNYDRIKNGMTQAQVEQILGEPDDLNSIELGQLSGSTAQWIGREHAITVTFANGKVAFKRFSASPETE